MISATLEGSGTMVSAALLASGAKSDIWLRTPSCASGQKFQVKFSGENPLLGIRFNGTVAEIVFPFTVTEPAGRLPEAVLSIRSMKEPTKAPLGPFDSATTESKLTPAPNESPGCTKRWAPIPRSSPQTHAARGVAPTGPLTVAVNVS